MGFVTRVIKALLQSIYALVVLTFGTVMTSALASVAKADSLEARFGGQAIEIKVRNHATGRVCGVVKATGQRFISGDPILILGSYIRPIVRASYYSDHHSFKEEWDRYCEGRNNPEPSTDAVAKSRIEEAVKVIRWRFVDFKLISAQYINRMVCGVVKTRNVHGGYTEQRFVADFSEEQPVKFEDDYRREGRIYGAEQFFINGFNSEWDKYCSMQSVKKTRAN